MILEKKEYTDESGAQRLTLARPDQPAEAGIPLLDLGALELTPELETELRAQLWARGIREYDDALKRGASTEIVAALRAVYRSAASEIITLCQGERELIEELLNG